MRQSAPLRITPRPSVSLTAFLLSGHLLAAMTVFALVLPIGFKYALAGALCYSTHQSLRVARLGGGHRTLRIEALPDGRLNLQLGDGIWREANVAAGSVVTPWLIVLNLGGEGIPRNLVLAFDSVEREDHRRLRVWLRFRLSGGQG